MTVCLSMPVADIFGAGTCGKYLVSEFAKRGEVIYDSAASELMRADRSFVEPYLRQLNADVDCPLIQFAGPDLGPQTAIRGEPTVGYVFSEWDPVTPQQKKNLARFDVLVAGSEWNARIIREAGFECSAVPQGVDRTIFHPQERRALKDKFVIYSGGKFEHRKAQDLVIKAVKVLQERHDDIVLLASWFNIWDSRDFYAMAREEGLKIVGLPLYHHDEFAKRIAQSDIGLFPNRCEGGTNLVMMDYLALGKPVAANSSTGQADVLHPDYAFMLKGDDEALVEQMIHAVEQVYEDRELGEAMGRDAAYAMDAFPWARTADGLEAAIKQNVSDYAETLFHAA